MEKRAMASPGRTMASNHRRCKAERQPIKVWCAEHGVSFVQLLQVAAENER